MDGWMHRWVDEGCMKEGCMDEGWMKDGWVDDDDELCHCGSKGCYLL